MGTPMLWATIVLDTALWSSCKTSQTTLLDLVTTSLDRGANYPLTMRVAVAHRNDDPTERFILILLSQHSHRWKDVALWIDIGSLPFLADVRAHLPLLQTLDLYNLSLAHDGPYTDDIFEIAPNLTNAGLSDWYPKPLILPWSQLCSFMYRCADSSDATLTQTVLGTVLRCMACPRLETPKFLHSGLMTSRWNQPCFLDLARRSSLHATLVVLRIDAVIEEHQLLQCLTALPLLEDLYISDSNNHPSTITDSLLRQLVWEPDQPGLVPRLDFLRLNSLMRFRDDTLRDMVESRFIPERSPYIFALNMHYLSNRERDLSPAFVEMMSELEDLGEASFTIVTAKDEEYSECCVVVRAP
ncbi:hypothetical protein DFH06DRAFT_1424765 [Mycena polygramma]|nr:hypothetical protein DFH06DRAFT_1424765 [Mycena polygramma]